MLFLAIFSVALKDRVVVADGLGFVEFIIPGLIAMAMLQNAFANPSSMMVMGKVQGFIIDYLMPPLSAGEVVLAQVAASVTRSTLIGLLVAVATIYFTPFAPHDIGLLIFYSIAASIVMAALGMIAGIFSDSFDQVSAYGTYMITPLTFLSGTFYSIKRLPEFWQELNFYNPIFYMVDGFRYSLTGYHDGSLQIGTALIASLAIILYGVAWTLFARGVRIKS